RLTSLGSSGSDRSGRHPAQPRTPPPTAGQAPGLTFSPTGSSDSSSPNSNKSYGLSSGPYPYPIAGVGSTVQAILNATDEDAEPALRALAQKHLDVFKDPRYRDLDVPEWVQRVQSKKAKLLRRFTVSGIVKAMYDNSETLCLKRGRVYVSAAICACADDALKDPAPEGGQAQLALAQGLVRLASTWAAFFLWPFYGRAPTEPPLHLNDISGNATPTRDMTEVIMGDGLSSSRSSTLREDVLKRDGEKCTVTGDDDDDIAPDPIPPGMLTSVLEVAHLFKRSTAVYGGSDDRKFRSMAVTFEILKHYCQLPDKYIADMAFVDTPENAITIAERLHPLFDRLSWCLIPTATLHVYKFHDYAPHTSQLKRIPSLVTFKDHSVADQPPQPEPSQSLGKRTRDQRGIDLPSHELICLHAALAGVLHMSGAAGVFKLIADRHNHGDPPVPSTDGEMFWKGVVDGQGGGDLRQSVESMRLGPSV
ncbi:hypothetical protein LXA43DRAFT_1046692, partial [Ganoderma leucocontextum]